MSATDQARTRAEALLQPIPGTRRAGVDARGDARAELLRDEMLKDGYLRRDWPAIAQASGGLLTDLTKDFVVATCWASAAWETDGLPGLAAGLSLVQGLLEQYWDDMFPPPARIRQRDNALANFYEHVATRLQVVKTDPRQDTGAAPLSVVTTEHEADLAACLTLLDALHAAAQTRFSPPPPPRELRAQLVRLQAGLPKPAEEPAKASPPRPTARAQTPADDPPETANPSPRQTADPAPRDAAPQTDRATERPPAERPSPATRPAAASASPPGDTEPLEAAPRPPPNASEVPAYLNAVTPNLLRAAHSLRRQQPGDPLAYRLLRAAVWLRAAAPATDAQGRAPLEPLPPGIRTQCESMLRSGKWTDLLDASESAFAAPQHRFCLDLHRYSAAALEHLDHTTARTALLAELAGLLHRVPGLLDLQARDGTPLADPDTRTLLGPLRPGSPAASHALSLGAAAPVHLSPGPSASTAALAAPAHLPLAPSQPPPRPPLPAPVDPFAASGAADLTAALAAARARLAARDLPGAIALLQQHTDTAVSPRARFEARIAIAHLTLEAGLVPVARAQTTALLRESDERRLADWEPHLVARVLDIHISALRAAPRPPDGADLQRHFDHLSVLDPAAAARQSAHART